MNEINHMKLLLLIMGISLMIVGVIFLLLYFQLRDNKEKYINYANQYPIYHWRFLTWRYLIEVIIGLTFILLTLGFSMLIVFFS